ncbi:transcription factor bHLH168-like [Lolium rigidum]|uniref:transcription factor bHLH168-like n=1 Tax=Lolium rigidum TaxID=89674 RepID=UPI001F5DD969|nr:transcription factor bHLH168-like [Lolium rigidum]
MEVKEKAKAEMVVKRTRMNSSTTTAPVERKETEKERRQHMKELYAKLASLIPKEHCSSTDTLTLLGSLDEAVTYIKRLKDRVDELHKRRSSAQYVARLRGGACSAVSTMMSGGIGSELEVEKEEKGLLAPVVEVRYHNDLTMDVMLICSVKRPIKLHEVIAIHQEEGAEIVNANHSVARHKIFYSIHSRAFSSRIGIDVSRVSERLGALVYNG